MKIIQNLIKDHKDEWLVMTSAAINSRNPMIDRIMEDDSVQGVIMTNMDGIPVLTNMSTVNAAIIGRHITKLGDIARKNLKEIDVFDEIIILRICTKKGEVLLAPHSDFSIIVVQGSRLPHKKKVKKQLSN